MVVNSVATTTASAAGPTERKSGDQRRDHGHQMNMARLREANGMTTDFVG
jgi:hypothetical protein